MRLRWQAMRKVALSSHKNPFCLDAQIRRREQLNELTEQLESAVPEEAQGSCHWVYSSVPEALTMVQCTDDKTIKEWHNESFQVRQAELGICPRTTVTSDVSTFGHVHDHISLTTEERVKAYRSELVMRELIENMSKLLSVSKHAGLALKPP